MKILERFKEAAPIIAEGFLADFVVEGLIHFHKGERLTERHYSAIELAMLGGGPYPELLRQILYSPEKGIDKKVVMEAIHQYLELSEELLYKVERILKECRI